MASPEEEVSPTESLYSVEKILDKRQTSGRIEYFVKWYDFPDEANTWEPIEHLFEGCYHLIKQFENIENRREDDNETIAQTHEPQTDCLSERPHSSLSTESTIVSEMDSTETDSNTEVDDTTYDLNSMSIQSKDIITDKNTHTEDKENTPEDTKQEQKACPQVVDNQSNVIPVINRSVKDAVYTGFIAGLKPFRIVDANFDGKNIYFWMEWSNSHVSIVMAKEANIKCPQIVIKWYESCIHFI